MCNSSNHSSGASLIGNRIHRLPDSLETPNSGTWTLKRVLRRPTPSAPLKHLIAPLNVHSDVTTQWLLLITVSLSEVMRTNYVQRYHPDSVGNTLHYFDPTSAIRNVLIFITVAARVLFYCEREYGFADSSSRHDIISLETTVYSWFWIPSGTRNFMFS